MSDLAIERDAVLRELQDRTNQTWLVKRKRWALLVLRQSDEIARLRAALLNCARRAEALKQDCGMDPESKQAVRNAQYQNISTAAHIALGTIRGPEGA